MKKIIVLMMLACGHANAQTAVTPAPAVPPTTGIPTESEINNAYGICQANRFKSAWQPGYENCNVVERAFQDRIVKMHQQAVDDVVSRIK